MLTNKICLFLVSGLKNTANKDPHITCHDLKNYINIKHPFFLINKKSNKLNVVVIIKGRTILCFKKERYPIAQQTITMPLSKKKKGNLTYEQGLLTLQSLVTLILWHVGKLSPSQNINMRHNKFIFINF